MANAVDVTPSGITASANFTPVAEAYGAADIIGSTMEFSFSFSNGILVPNGSLIRILSTVLKIDKTGVTSGETSYSLPLYSVTPPSAQANNDAWTLASADLTAYRGTLSLGTPVDLGAALYVKSQLSDQQDIKLTGNSLFGRLVTAGAYTAPSTTAIQVLLYGIVL